MDRTANARGKNAGEVPEVSLVFLKRPQITRLVILAMWR